MEDVVVEVAVDEVVVGEVSVDDVALVEVIVDEAVVDAVASLALVVVAVMTVVLCELDSDVEVEDWVFAPVAVVVSMEELEPVEVEVVEDPVGGTGLEDRTAPPSSPVQ